MGGTLRLGKLGDVATIDPHSWGPSNGFSIFAAFDRLINYDDKLTPQPELAESWERSSDGLQLTVNLRKNVQFHNGKEMTSDDVVYTSSARWTRSCRPAWCPS
jgi:peptide/nickel transport system substrate-binding protein